MYLIIIILPLLGSVFSGFLGRKIGTTGAHIITCSCVITTTLLSIFAFIEVGLNNIPVSLKLFRWIDSESINILWFFHFDSLTVSMLIPVLIVSSLVHIYSISYMSHDPHNQRFFSYLSLFTFMMIILVTGNNLLVMFVGWEGVGVCSYLLVCFWYTRIWANQSSLSAFLTNRVGDTFLTIGMFAIIWSVGNLDYSTVFSLAPYISENIVTIIGICLLIGAMAKSSQVGLHVWLPMAMEGPTPVSALIHAATMVTAGVYLLMRTSPLIEYSSTVLILCLWLGATTTVFSSLIGLFQQDIKKVIAYSTMSQLGMMVIAIGLSSYNIALFHLVNHAFYKALLFLGAGSVIHSVADNQDFRKYGGLIYFLPLTYSVMLIASLSLVAFPFMTGFYSKDFILESAYGKYYLSSISVYFIATIGAMFTTLYSVKVLYLTFLTNPNGPLVNYKNAFANADASIQHNNIGLEGNIYMSLPLIILALFSIFFGYITKDLFIGLGTDFFIDNSVFIHPCHEIILDTEFSVPTIFKLLPLYLTILLSFISIILSEFIPKLLVYFKFNRIGYNIFGFFNQRFLIELFYNKYITNLILYLGGQTTKFLDKGSVELVGPFGLEKLLKNLSKQLSGLNTGVITSYAVFILIGLIIYIEIFYYTSYFKETVILQDNLSETLYQVGFNNSQVISYSLYFPPVFKYFICELNTKGFPWLLDGPLNNIHFIVMLYLILNSLLVYNFYIIRYFFEKNKLKKIFNNNIHYNKTSVNSYINKNIAFVFLLYYMAGDSYNAVEITLYADIFNNIGANLTNIRVFGDGACTYLPLISSTSMINTSNNLFSYLNFINFDGDFFITSFEPNFNITLLSLYNSYLLELSKLYGYIPIMLPVVILAINSIIYNFYIFIEILSFNFIKLSNKYLDLSKLNKNISQLETTSSSWEGVSLKKNSVHSLLSDLPGYSVFSDPDSKLMSYTTPSETNLSVFMNTGMDTGINTDITNNGRDVSPITENEIMDQNIQTVNRHIRNIVNVIYQYFVSLSINQNTSSIWLRRLAFISSILPSFIIVLICLNRLDQNNIFNEMQSLINVFTQLVSYMDEIYVNISIHLDTYSHDAPDNLLGGLNTNPEDRSIFILRAILTELLNIVFNNPDFFVANDYINHTHGILPHFFSYTQTETGWQLITEGPNILSFRDIYGVDPFTYTNINNYLGIDLTNVNGNIPHVWYNNFLSLANLNINNFYVTILPNQLEGTLFYERMGFHSFYHAVLGFHYHLNENIADINNWLSDQGINISSLQNNLNEFLSRITTNETTQIDILTEYDDEGMSFDPEPDSDMEDDNQDYFMSDN